MLMTRSRKDIPTPTPPRPPTPPKPEGKDSKLGSKIDNLEEKIRLMQGLNSFGNTNFSSMSWFPNMTVPPKFKAPKFEKYNGRGDPMIHLQIYCWKMAPYSDNELLLIQTFQDTLTGHAAEWMEKKSSETFREYAQRWREKAARARPPLEEKEMIKIFVDTLKNPYFDRMIGLQLQFFVDLIPVGERIEDAVKTKKILDMSALLALAEQAAKKASTKKKEGDVQMIGRSNERPRQALPTFTMQPIQPRSTSILTPTPALAPAPQMPARPEKRPIVYFSEKLNGAALNYLTYDKELYALELYINDDDFASVFGACEKAAFGKFYRLDGYLFRENRLCVPNSSMRELLVREAHGGVNERTSLDGQKKAEMVKKLYESVRQHIEKKNEQYANKANKGRRQVIFEPGDYLGDDSRSNPFKERGNDENQQAPLKDPLHVPVRPIIRARSKKIKKALNGLIQDIWADSTTGHSKLGPKEEEGLSWESISILFAGSQSVSVEDRIKKALPRTFQPGDLVLKKRNTALLDTRGKFTPSYEGPYVVKKAFSGGVILLADMDGEEFRSPINFDSVIKYHV
uniref:Retrotransposon gag domain-containing protein n=1 Tax=Fagus sylvatica TaxID=28930 RepID=A0A2N9G2N0_FAGSY